MKHNILYIATAVLAASALGACEDEFTHPPVIMPPTVDIQPTTTLLDVKTEYWSALSSPTEVAYPAAGDTLIFEGRVCSSDEDGNFYKSIVIQSVDEQGNQTAINFSVNDKELYKIFPFGQEVAVYASGLTIGGYNNLMQFGVVGESGMTFMPLTTFKEHVTRNHYSLPQPEKVVSTPTTIKALNGYKNSSAETMQWQSRLVKVENVSWPEAGFSYAADGNVSRYIQDEDGNILIVRNSGSSTFKNEILPAGTGSVTGVLGMYNSDWQLTIINPSYLEGFDAPVANAGVEPAGEGTAANPYNVTKAYELVKSGNIPAGDVYVTGEVLVVTEFSESYGNASYSIADPDGKCILFVYRGKAVNGDKFTAANCPKQGDKVTIKGSLMVFSGNPQMGQGNELVGENAGGDTPDVTVEPAGSGTETDPYNVAAAIQLITSGNIPAGDVAVKGKISKITELSTQYGNATYDIVDEGSSVALTIYRGKWLNGDKFTAEDQLAVGAEVVVSGTLVYFNNKTPEMTTGNVILSYNGNK